MSVFTPGSHGSTFGGNPLGCAVARAGLRVLTEERLAERSAELGRYLLEQLRTIENPLFAEIRGRGLFVGIELKPEAGGARRYCEQLMTEGLLCKETHENVLRFAPPLIITRADLDWALERVRKILHRP
jgi:ornithine--oxo-acid transaminase